MTQHEKVQTQFGRSAQQYVTSQVHAKGADLQRLVDLVQPQPEWIALDIATGGGHTAFTFAPHVAQVVATDLTDEMLVVAAAEAEKRKLSTIRFQSADAQKLPFEDDQFDLVTCRIAPHHFPDTFQFLQESRRVLKAGGTFALIDNTVPDGIGGDYINAYETLRDPSHNRCLSIEEWEQDLFAAQFRLTHKETYYSSHDFDGWAARMQVAPLNRIRLKAMLVQAPDEAAAVLTPTFQGDRITFHIQTTLFIAM